MSRLPRNVAAYPLQPGERVMLDDVLMSNNTWVYGDWTPVDKSGVVPLSRSCLHPNPLKYYSNFFAAEGVCYAYPTHVDIAADDIHLLEMFPFVNPLWKSVRFHFHTGEPCEAEVGYKKMFEIKDEKLLTDIRFVGIDTPERHALILRRELNSEWDRNFADLIGSISNTHEQSINWYASVTDGGNTCVGWPKFNLITISYAAKYHSLILDVIAQMRRKAGWTARYTPVDYMFGDIQPGSEATLLDRAFTNLEMKPTIFANLRWPMYMYEITEVSLSLLCANLPPYVVLWIVNFLPKMWCWADSKKIKLIESIRDSINRIRASRDLEPI